MKRLVFVLLLSVTSYMAQAIKTGCDWWVKANGVWGLSNTTYDKSCAAMVFLYMDGTPVPKENVQCCDWSGDFYTGTGINCAKLAGEPVLPAGSPVPSGPPVIDGAPRSRPTHDGLHGNWVVEGKIKIAMDGNGNVSLHYPGFSKTHLLFNVEQKYDNKPVNITAQRSGDQMRVMVTPLEGKTNHLDTSGTEYITYRVSDLKQLAYQANIDEMITLFPNPVKEGKTIQLASRFTDEQVEVAIYSKTGVCVFTTPLTKPSLDIELARLKKEVYFYTFIINGVVVKGGSLVIE